MRSQGYPAFTLAELLIALAILGVIATFTIPKILSAQQSEANLSKAKEAVAILSEAYQKYQYANNYNVPITAASGDLTPYINYVKLETTATVDLRPNFSGGVDCSNGGIWICLRLHNGGTLIAQPSNWAFSFGGTSSTNAFNFAFDPDSSYSGFDTTDAPGQGVEFWLYYNGKVRTSATMENPTGRSDGDHYMGPGHDPSWFTWD